MFFDEADHVQELTWIVFDPIKLGLKSSETDLLRSSTLLLRAAVSVIPQEDRIAEILVETHDLLSSSLEVLIFNLQ